MTKCLARNLVSCYIYLMIFSLYFSVNIKWSKWGYPALSWPLSTIYESENELSSESYPDSLLVSNFSYKLLDYNLSVLYLLIVVFRFNFCYYWKVAFLHKVILLFLPVFLRASIKSSIFKSLRVVWGFILWLTFTFLLIKLPFKSNTCLIPDLDAT